MSGAVVGVDVGGTFTDLILMEPESGAVRLAKVPSTPANQAAGVLAALDGAPASLADVAAIVHGTTVTTNALLERKLSRTGLITTQGFRDILELGRRTRPNAYGLTGSFTPLIPRELRIEVPERMDAAGEVLVPLDEAAVWAAISALQAAGCDSLVIHFLHSYKNPEHEERALAVAGECWPAGYVTAGHAILAEFREFERGVAAAVNACVQPLLHRYLDRLQGQLSGRGYERELLVIQGNGGSVSARSAAAKAVNTVLSGPASGVMAAAAIGRAAGAEQLITFDTGGTSADVGLVLEGVPAVSAEMELEHGMPIHVPMVDVHTVGAGGGSLARIDEAGLLQVGPESAGAQPGPICYGRGGERPTLTDANLILGRLDPDALLAVENPVAPDAVRIALGETVGAPLGLDADAAAAAVIRIANDRMAGAIRMATLARGHDPRDFVLFAFGGAGPMHAAALAAELGIPQVMIPARPGITSAVGCITADLRHDYVNTVNAPLAEADMGAVRAILERQAADGRTTIKQEGVAVGEIAYLHAADMQFEGQTHLLTVPVDSPAVTREALQQAFEAAYWERFAVALDKIPAVLVNLHTAVIGARPPVPLAALGGQARASSLDGALIGTRRVWFPAGWAETPVYDRDRLPAGASFPGPAIVQQTDCTSVVEPGNRASLDSIGNLILDVSG